jgi:hypothetical protein
MKTIWRSAFWLLLLGTFYLSLIPSQHIPTAFSFWDKAQHASAFATLAYVGLRAYPGRLVLLLCGLSLFGVAIEVAQWLTGWRFGDWQDWIADCAGLALGWAAWRVRCLLASKRP